MDQFAAQHDRTGHAAAVARADDRGRDAQLRRRSELRLSRHDFVAERRRRRCRCRTTRRSCSSACSATAAPTPSAAARRAAVGQPARLGARRSVVAAAQAAGRRSRPRRSVSGRRPRDRAPHSEGREAGVDGRSSLPDAPDRRAEGRRSAHQADVRPAGARAGRPTSRA